MLAWNGVVAEANSPLVMHGRRGIDFEAQPTLDRYARTQTGQGPQSGTHMNLPYLSGDVLLQTDNDAAQVRASFAEPSGAVRQFYMSHANPDSGPEGQVSAARRYELNEAPFVSKTSSGVDPTLDPSHIDLAAYYYASVARPGERVRGGVTEDNTDTYYWRFGEQYGGQPGMGVQGDLPGDVKFQYLGGVIRTPQRNYYARYGSLWVMLPDNDRVGSRVVAPLSENLLKAGGKDIKLFTVLTLTKPGTVLETGNTFGIAGQVGPTVQAKVRVEINGPGNYRQIWEEETNEIGQYYISTANRKLETPGIYTVSVAVSAGGVQGQLFDWSSFPLPVVPQGAAFAKTNLPASGIVQQLTVNAGVETGNAVRALLTVPGWIVQDKEVRASATGAVLTLDAKALQEQYTFIDTQQPADTKAGLADSFVWVIMTGDGAILQVPRVVFQGPQLWNLDP